MEQISSGSVAFRVLPSADGTTTNSELNVEGERTRSGNVWSGGRKPNEHTDGAITAARLGQKSWNKRSSIHWKFMNQSRSEAGDLLSAASHFSQSDRG